MGKPFEGLPLEPDSGAVEQKQPSVVDTMLQKMKAAIKPKEDAPDDLVEKNAE